MSAHKRNNNSRSVSSFLKGIKLVLSMFQEIAFISNIMDLFKDDWGPDISLKDLNLFKHSISLNLHILILYNRV